MTTPVLWQGDKRWRDLRIGVVRPGAPKCSAVGCLVTAYAQALRDLDIEAEATPITVQARGVFVRSSLIQPDTAKAVGLIADDVVRTIQGQQAMRTTLVTALASGARVILHVDGDHDDGSDEGRHFVLARRLEGDVVVVADPATAREERLSLATLSGPVRWSADDVKQYEVRSVRPLRRA